MKCPHCGREIDEAAVEDLSGCPLTPQCPPPVQPTVEDAWPFSHESERESLAARRGGK